MSRNEWIQGKNRKKRFCLSRIFDAGATISGQYRQCFGVFKQALEDNGTTERFKCQGLAFGRDCPSHRDNHSCSPARRAGEQKNSSERTLPFRQRKNQAPSCPRRMWFCLPYPQASRTGSRPRGYAAMRGDFHAGVYVQRYSDAKHTQKCSGRAGTRPPLNSSPFSTKYPEIYGIKYESAIEKVTQKDYNRFR